MATSVNLEDVKFIDKKAKDIVNGYINETQNSFPTDNIYYTIPTLVIHWILLYFHALECFDPDNHCKNVTLSDDNTVLTKEKQCRSLSYLSMEVSKGIHVWTFKILNNYYNYSIEFGIWKTKFPVNTLSLLYDCNKGAQYGWRSTSRYLTQGDTDRKDIKYTDRICKTGDIIDMILNLNEYTLSYKCNGDDYGIAFKDIELTTYRAVVGFFHQKDSIKFVSYKRQS